MRRLAVGAAVALAVAVPIWLVVRFLDDDPPVRGLAPAIDAFGSSDTLPSGATWAAYGPDGARIALLADGLVHMAGGEVNRVTAPDANVVDAAWFPGATALLVAEGPAQTGALVVVERDGDVRGTVPLAPAVGFGHGYGMAVLANERAVITTVEREAIGGMERRSLAVVDLTTGSVTPLELPAGQQEYGPHAVDATTVLYTAARDDGVTSARILDVVTGERRDAGLAGSAAAGVAIVGDTTFGFVLGGRDLDAVPLNGGSRHRVTTLPGGETLVAIRPDGAEAVVAVAVTEPDGSTQTRLQRRALPPPVIRPAGDAPRYAEGP